MFGVPPVSRSYWRSLAQIEDLPEYRAALEREFPEGASELPDGITRREMMMLVGASLSLAGLAACRRPVEEIVPYVTAPEEFVPGIPRYYATTMPFRRSAHGLIVESHEGRPTKIEGNPSHPSALGASSSRVQASVLGLYDPDRSQSITLKGARKSWNDFVTSWGERSKAHAADGGAGLAVLCESFSSPTLARLASELRARYPRLQWATYDAVSDENRLAGLRQATGRDIDLMLRFDRASVILCLDADPLLTDPEMIRHARGFADGRRAGAVSTSAGQTSSGAMNRLYAVEGVYSLTGAMADHRLRLESRQIAAFVAALAMRLGAPGASSQSADVSGVDRRWIDAVAKDLLANRGRGLIVAGERQPAVVHAAVFALNAHLGNTGKTVSYYETKDASLPSVNSLTSLASAMKGGAVQTLVILGGNPVFDAPADLDFASAMAKVPHTIALGHTVDETSSKTEWQIPRAHYLESWGDTRAVGGTLSVVQPLILPLFGGRTPVEVLGLMVGDKDRPGYDIVRDTWKPILGESDFDKKWNRVLHDGLLAGSELTEVVPDVKGEVFGALARATGSASGLEIVFVPSPSLHDGRFANDGWLQELPDPLTKLTWDNPALLSPKTAETLGLANEELVRLDYAGRSLDLPVWILPGMADGVLALTLGYGRQRAGRIGSQVGFDTFKVRASTALGFDSGVRLTKLGGKHPLSATQDHGSMEGRPIVRESTVSELRSPKKEEEKPGALGVFEAKPEHFSLWKEHTYDQGHQWGMTIDLNTCIGCNACMVACQSENNVPVTGREQVAYGRKQQWLRVERWQEGSARKPLNMFLPMFCQHCEVAPCEPVCPVYAAYRTDEGLNGQVYNRCVGTRYCGNNCPYHVRRFNWFQYEFPEPLDVQLNPDVTVRQLGVMEKCTMCLQRIIAGKDRARDEKRPVRDGDIQTACQQTCPTQAITFGNLKDEGSAVTKLTHSPRAYHVLEEIGTRPSITYLRKVVRGPHA